MAVSTYLYISASVLLVLLSGALGETCTNPQVTSKTYTSTEERMSSETALIVEFSLACKNGAKGLNLYADFNGRTFPVSRIIDSDKYQVSFVNDHKKMSSGHYTVRFFDEERYAELRKAQRSGDDTATVKSLFDVPVYHPGTSHGPWIQTEHLATGLAILVWYYAYTTRSRLQS